MGKLIFIGGSRLLRGGLRIVLENSGDHIAAEHDTVEEAARETSRTTEPLIYLLKHSPEKDTITRQITALRRADPEGMVAVLTERLSPHELIETFAAGRYGMLLEDIDGTALHESLKLIELGEKVFPSQLATLLCDSRRAPRGTTLPLQHPVLTGREVEIVCRLAQGMANKEIANDLDLSVATVKVHVKSLLKKLGLNNRTQAAIWAVDAGLADMPQALIPFEKSEAT